MLPRGIRNNNPLNIRVGNNWLGEVDQPTDKDFEQFKDMSYGIRAALILLRRYILRYHLSSVLDIISRWAPNTENNTNKYIRFVSERLGVGALEKLDWKDNAQMVNLVCAMAYYENGQEIDPELVRCVYTKLKWE